MLLAFGQCRHGCLAFDDLHSFRDAYTQLVLFANLFTLQMHAAGTEVHPTNAARFSSRCPQVKVQKDQKEIHSLTEIAEFELKSAIKLVQEESQVKDASKQLLKQMRNNAQGYTAKADQYKKEVWRRKEKARQEGYKAEVGAAHQHREYCNYSAVLSNASSEH